MNPFYKLFCFIFPEHCPYCGVIVKSEAIACDRCMEKIDALQKPIIRGAHGYKVASSFVYDGYARRMILRLKFHDRIQYVPQIAVILGKDIRRVYPDADFDVVTAVPMHPKDLKNRGYNQSELLAKELAKRMIIPYAELLDKIKHTKKQQRCSYQERKTNLRGAFKVTDKSLIEGRRILIVDDIVTTGETLGACCKTINKAKPQILCCVTIANAGERAHQSGII